MQKPPHAARPVVERSVDRAKRLARSVPDRARRATDGVRIRARRAVHRGGHVPGLLSIVVPCYQVEDFLDECLVSLRFQRYREVEIIVVDDGSPDRSGEIARRHARRDLRVRVVTRENGGLSAARNTGIEHARGEFLTFVDSDDVVTPDAYTSAIDALRESGSDFVVSCYDRLENKKRVPAGSWIRSHPRPQAAGRRPRHVPRGDGQRGRVEQDLPPRVLGPGRPALPRGQDLRGPAGERRGVRAGARRSTSSPTSRSRGASATTARRSRRAPGRPATSPRTTTRWPRRSRPCGPPGKDRAVQIRALQLISYNMPFFTRHLVKGGPEFWSLLREALLDLVHRVSREEFVHSVGAQDKVLVELIANDRRDEAVDYIENWGSEVRRFPTRATPEGHPGRAAADRGPARRRQHPLRPPARADGSRDAGDVGGRAAHGGRLGLHPQPRPGGQPAGVRRRAGLRRRQPPASRSSVETFSTSRGST